MNELLSTIESGQKEPHSNNKDASTCVKERRSLLFIACAVHVKSGLSCYGLNDCKLRLTFTSKEEP
eukprot:599183-Amphidinium_carterae.1